MVMCTDKNVDVKQIKGEMVKIFNYFPPKPISMPVVPVWVRHFVF